jgi:translation initiation factor IF-3
VPRVRLVGATGEFIGIVPIAEALQRAQANALDLVEVSPNADPPVCRVMDYGKFKYEKSKKAKEAKKKQHVMHLKEIKLHPKTDSHDYGFKMDHARKFLIKGDRVKVTLVFRGREITHMEFGKQILERAEADLAELSVIELSSRREGRNLISSFLPDKAKIKEFLRKMELKERTLSLEDEPIDDSNEPDEADEADESEQPDAEENKPA